jgi:hypothetical protein
VNVFEAALRARLVAFAPLVALLASAQAVYQTVTESAPLPYVVFGLNAGGPLNRTPHRSESLLYLVKGVTRVGVKQAGQIDDQIDAALHDQPLTVPGWSNYWLVRETRVRLEELDAGGKPIFHAGGLYRARLAV